MKKKCIALVNYSGNTIYNVTFINNQGEPTTMYSRSDDILAPCYQSFTHMYNAVLILARNNGYTIPYYTEFNARWYNILWCDIKKPTEFNRFPYHGEYAFIFKGGRCK
ncbi:MAG: hypothetical protein J6S67_01335 [Methanobrevibacter sp.]|nr:hypothetical protein [Methanobrevibacter sp.]